MKLLKLKRKYRNATLTLRSGLQNNLPFDVTIDFSKADPQDFNDYYDMGFKEVFDVVEDVSSSEIIRSGYLKENNSRR